MLSDGLVMKRSICTHEVKAKYVKVIIIVCIQFFMK